MITCPACGEQNPEARTELKRARGLAEQLGAEPITSEVAELLEGVPAP